MSDKSEALSIYQMAKGFHWSLMSLHDIVSLFFHIAFCHQIDLAADRIQCQNLKVNSTQIGKEEKKEELQKITANLIMLFTLPQSVLFFLKHLSVAL